MDHDQLAATIGAACRLTGEFRLRSGQTSTTYFDKYLFEADPDLLAAIAEHAVALIPSDTEVLAGLELGGVPVATALSLRTGLPLALVRKKAKEYGTMKLAEGAEVAGRRVLVVEDVITTGGQVVLSVEELRARSAVADDVLCIIDRSQNHDLLNGAGIGVRSLFTGAELTG